MTKIRILHKKCFHSFTQNKIFITFRLRLIAGFVQLGHDVEAIIGKKEPNASGIYYEQTNSKTIN